MRTFLLFLVYCLVVTPAGLVSRIVKDPMARRRPAGTETYWTAPTPAQAR
ncbi:MULTISPECIES: hypothetical protein [Streptomyces]|uniref:Uncharacterized protein n=2 Tax=Streptomyces TaxID=1883 RepID=A0ABS9J8L7_9ACTN|nr:MULTISPECIES: hypothetical protein [Streptomyces]MCG0061906.1 hypothetical protein [Streptomyces tricolor]BCM70473.1 hypothetical protein EASAB2608_05807 [Streptomyces sp. EAS-AB2608]CUW32172.1 hypothetical protein TUE45_06921 [Streptomyces reticuli]